MTSARARPSLDGPQGWEPKLSECLMMRLLTALLAVRVARPHVDGIMGVSCVNSSRAGDVVCGVANSATGSSCMLRLTRADDDARYRLSQSTPLAQWDSNPHGVLLERRRSAGGDGDDDGERRRRRPGLRPPRRLLARARRRARHRRGGRRRVRRPAARRRGGVRAGRRGERGACSRRSARASTRTTLRRRTRARSSSASRATAPSRPSRARARRAASRRAAASSSRAGSRARPRPDEAGERDGAGCALGVANHTDIFELCGAGRLAEVARLPRASAAAAVPRDFHQIARAAAGAGAYALLDADNGAVYLWRRAEPERLELVAGAANASSGFCDARAGRALPRAARARAARRRGGRRRRHGQLRAAARRRRGRCASATSRRSRTSPRTTRAAAASPRAARTATATAPSARAAPAPTAAPPPSCAAARARGRSRSGGRWPVCAGRSAAAARRWPSWSARSSLPNEGGATGPSRRTSKTVAARARPLLSHRRRRACDRPCPIAQIRRKAATGAPGVVGTSVPRIRRRSLLEPPQKRHGAACRAA